MVPKDTLGDMIQIRHGYAFSSEYFRERPTEYILLTPGNFHIDKRLNFGSKTKYYDGPIPQGYILANGDLLVVMTDLTKNMAILGNAVILESDKYVLHNQRIGLVDITAPNQLNRDFLCYLLNSDEVQRHIRATASGTTVRHTAPKRFLEVAVKLPPLPEQRKIAEILSVWDRAIEVSEALLATATAQKRSLMQSLLTGHRRFPEFEGQAWKEVRLGEVCEPKQWPTISQKEMLRSGYPVFGANGFIGFYNRYNHEKATTVVTCRGATCGTVSRTPPQTYITGNAMSLDDVASDIVHEPYLFHALQYRGFVDIISGSAQPQIIGKDIKSVKIDLPAIGEQQKMSKILDDCDVEVLAFEKQIHHLRTEKQALMQQLLTGKKRVVV